MEFKLSTVKISGSSIIDVAGDSYTCTHYGFGDIYSIQPSQAGKQLRRQHHITSKFEPPGSV